MKNQGFTTTELLISVAVLGVIAAIATPSYQYHVAKSQIHEANQMIQIERLNVVSGLKNNSCSPRTVQGKYGTLFITGTLQNKEGQSCDSGCDIVYKFNNTETSKFVSGKVLAVDVRLNGYLSKGSETNILEALIPDSLNIPPTILAGESCAVVSGVSTQTPGSNLNGNDIGDATPTPPGGSTTPPGGSTTPPGGSTTPPDGGSSGGTSPVTPPTAPPAGNEIDVTTTLSNESLYSTIEFDEYSTLDNWDYGMPYNEKNVMAVLMGKQRITYIESYPFWGNTLTTNLQKNTSTNRQFAYPRNWNTTANSFEVYSLQYAVAHHWLHGGSGTNAPYSIEARTLYTINDKGNQDAIYIKLGNTTALKFEKGSINDGFGIYHEKSNKTAAQVLDFVNTVSNAKKSNTNLSIRISTKPI